MTSLDALVADMRARAEAATPGPWCVSGIRLKLQGEEWAKAQAHAVGPDRECVAAVLYDERQHGRCWADARFVAVANPENMLHILDGLKERDATIAAALARAEAAEREVAALKEGLRPFADLAGTYTVETMPADGIFTLSNKAVGRMSGLRVSHLRRAAALLSPDHKRES